MYPSNITNIILLGFTNINSFKYPIFVLFFIIYCATICGNLLIIMLVSYSKNLHFPMYYFLIQLSISDIILVTDIVPNLLQVILLNKSIISVTDCLTQLYVFGFSEALECFILTVMSYDRYIAICKPLHYHSIMNPLFSVKLIIVSWIISFTSLLIQASQIAQLHFCGPNVIDHFFCDLDPVLKLSCSSVFTIRLIGSIMCFPFLLLSFIVIIISYIYIIYTVIRMTSVTGREKAFSTCSSHFVVVSIYYLTLNSMYLMQTKGKSYTMSKLLSLLYTVITPFLNPIIYCLRNRDIIKTMTKYIQAVNKYCRKYNP